MQIFGNLFVISAPSGTGKTKLIRQLITDVPNLMVSVSHTTRQKREGEVDGVHYHFITQDKFNEMLSNGAFLENAHVYGNYYGTSFQSIKEGLNSGSDVILEIDWQGAKQIRNLYPESTSIFIFPPSIQALRDRLEGRKQDSQEIIDGRMNRVREELLSFVDYDYLVLNDNYTIAYDQLKSIIVSQRTKWKLMSNRILEVIRAG